MTVFGRRRSRTTNDPSRPRTSTSTNLVSPAAPDEVAHAVRGADAVTVVRGTRGVPFGGADPDADAEAVADVVVDVSTLSTPPRLDADGRTITVAASADWVEVCAALVPHGMALRNLPADPRIAVAEAVSHAEHGGGARHGNLATQVAGLEVVTAAGEVVHLDRRTPDFDGMVVSFGALGVVTAVTLDVVFDFEVEQHVYDDLPLDVAVDDLSLILGAADSVSVFTTFAGAPSGQVGQVWLKRRADGSDRSMLPGPTFLDAPAATMQHHPVPGADPALCTPQLGVPGPWHERLPHLRAGVPEAACPVAPTRSEYFVDARHASAALDAIRTASASFVDDLAVAEIRAVAADELWMSPQYGRDAVGFHFTWSTSDPTDAIAAVESALADHDPRPQWGTRFDPARFGPARDFEMHEDFVDLVVRFDPHGVFRHAGRLRHLGFG